MIVLPSKSESQILSRRVLLLLIRRAENIKHIYP